MILVVDSDEVFSKCLVRYFEKAGYAGQMSNNAVQAMEIINATTPEMIFIDVYLTGPDGFTLLNELASYPDTMKIPVAIVTDRDFSKYNLNDYNVVGVLNKETLRPEEVFLMLDKCLGARFRTCLGMYSEMRPGTKNG